MKHFSTPPAHARDHQPDSSMVTAAELPSWIAATAAAEAEELIKMRRDLHAHPELSGAEFRTTALVAEELRRLGLQPRILPVSTGLVCDVVPPGWPAERGLVALRADLDALPLTELTGLPFASTVAGAAHACGHDVHTTVLLGVARLLVQLRAAGGLARGVRLIFQPSEEASPGGATDVVAGGGMEGVESVFAIHCDPSADVGAIGLRSGPITSAADQVIIEVCGPGGHTSRPHLSADLIGGLAALANQLPLLLSRRVDPRGTASLLWGVIEGGQASNAIPESGRLQGTLRCLDPDTWLAARALLPALVQQVLTPWGELSAAIELSGDIPPTVNHPAAVAQLARAGQTIGWDAVIDTPQSLGGEDFGVLLAEAPGAMARLGVRTPGEFAWPDLHRPDFCVDEAAIEVGVRFLTAAVTLDQPGR